uniref:Uncharacterized protein n=1 Tax=viral metagenome TaxID=1070528 RepID=A0A6M3KAL8_9ZZZZ
MENKIMLDEAKALETEIRWIRAAGNKVSNLKKRNTLFDQANKLEEKLKNLIADNGIDRRLVYHSHSATFTR